MRKNNGKSPAKKASRLDIIRRLEVAFEKVASDLNVPVDKIYWVASQLDDRRKKQAKTVLRNERRRRRVRAEREKCKASAEEKRTKTIIAMVRKGATQDEIGEVVGVSYECVRRLMSKIAQENGGVALRLDESLWTVQRAAEELGVSTAVINRICADGEVSGCRRGHSEVGAWLIDEAGIETLRNHFLVTQEKRCDVCGAVFSINGTRAITCSDKCSTERKERLQRDCLSNKPTIDTLVGWHKKVWLQLKDYRIPKDEKWVTITEARKLTGLSNMQLVWLRQRDIVSIRPHLHKTWGGDPVAMYAVSELKIVKRVKKAFDR